MLRAEYSLAVTVGARSRARSWASTAVDATSFTSVWSCSAALAGAAWALKRFPDPPRIGVLKPELRAIGSSSVGSTSAEGFFSHAPVPRDAATPEL